MRFLSSAFVAIVVVSAKVPISSSTPYRFPGNIKGAVWPMSKRINIHFSW